MHVQVCHSTYALGEQGRAQHLNSAQAATKLLSIALQWVTLHLDGCLNVAMY